MGKIDIKTLLEAGAHFGHKTSRWNPKMRQFIHSRRGGIHIINLEKTAENLERSAKFAESVAASGKQVLFVGTKKHIAPAIKEAAESAGMPYVTQRWFGGMLTNFATISERIKHYKKLDEQLQSGELAENYNKREVLEFSEERDKLAKDLSGIVEMTKLPGALFVSDVIIEKTAVKEAVRLNIPVIAIVDSNGDPSPIDYVIPANDDALKTVKLIAEEIAKAVVSGRKHPVSSEKKAKSAVSKKATAKPSSAKKQPVAAEKKAIAKKPSAKKTGSEK